ncbi:MAG: hypothetical protein ACRC6R_07525 [Bacteroidales bacterium]
MRLTIYVSLMMHLMIFVLGASTLKAKDNGFDSSRVSMEQRVQCCFENSFKEEGNYSLTELIDELRDEYIESKDDRLLYWKSYAMYYNSILFLKKGDWSSAESEVKRGIDLLKRIQSKSSDDYALLSMLQNYSCQFASFPAIIKLSRAATSSIDMAIEIDPSNPRAYYVYANNDFNVPENYGGGKRVEEYALKSLELSSSIGQELLIPSWGRRECYELITNFYIKRNNKIKAKEYLDMGLKEYPNSFVLIENMSKISN